MVIAILDTGIDTGHADLAGGKVIGWHDGQLRPRERCTIGSPAAAVKATTVGAIRDPAKLGWALASFSSASAPFIAGVAALILSAPIAAPLVVEDWSGPRNFDIYLIDRAGIVVDGSTGVLRQKTIAYQPLVAGR